MNGCSHPNHENRRPFLSFLESSHPLFGIARFIPFIRTFAPFLAGVGKMSYRWFIAYNVLGAALWILGFTLAGYFFGAIPIVQQNFNYIIYAIIALSLFAVASIIVGIFRTARTVTGNPDTVKKE
jgi:membrane-associated protein